MNGPPCQCRPTDWKVLYGELRQFAAYFDDRARAERFARDHHSDTIVPLVAQAPRLDSAATVSHEQVSRT